MRSRLLFSAAALLSVISGYTVLAQHSHGHSAPSGKPAMIDGRQFVKFPPELIEHTLANMRDHLLALQEMQEHLGMGHPDVAAKIAEERLGMSSLGSHGAHNAAKHMPQGMQEMGSGMHRAASKFAVIAKDAAVTGEMKPVFSALAAITAQCVGCHAGYRIK